MKWIIRLIKYWFHPKYVLSHGHFVENRTIMFLRRDPKIILDPEYNCKVLTYSNADGVYDPRQIYCRIWTMRGLRKWVRLLYSPYSTIGHNGCVKRTWFGWKKCR